MSMQMLLCPPSPPVDLPDYGELPPYLRRPDASGAIATLEYVAAHSGEKEDIPAKWRLSGSSAVILMAEKMFSGAHASARRDTILFFAWSANFDDLLAIMQRYPVAIDDGARAAWEAQYAEAIRSYRFRALAPSAAAASRGRFKGELKPFQMEGVQFLLSNARGILADDMGLGKTVQALAAAEALDEWPVVVVAQPHVQSHWIGKIPEFLRAEKARSGFLQDAGALTFADLRGMKVDASIPAADIYVVHYLVLHAWTEFLIERGVKVAIFDEVQEFRAKGTRKRAALEALVKASRCAWGLSGTPIYNHGIEMLNVMDGVNPGCLGTRVDFQMRWCDHRDPRVVKEPEAFGAYLSARGLLLRRRKKDVQAQLPSKMRVIEAIDGDNASFAEMIKEAVRLAKEAEFEDAFERGRKEAEALRCARQATGRAKAPAAAAFITSLLEADQPTLVFAHHHLVHDALLATLAKFGPVSITGRESMAEKDYNRRLYMDGETNVCILALRAATGIDGLQHRTQNVVFVEFDWSPAVHAQAEDRAHRMGQQHQVMVYYLKSDLGTDPEMISLLGVKEAQALGILGDSGDSQQDANIARETAEEKKSAILDMLRSMR
ncbi:DEAD/DEAH box helicase [Methylocystis sp. SC2]|uniref:SNF2-related protein n=1 Tax=Methylocystis sp. (strain SC2) TaxID=187303 RepID=UPI001FCBD360|nr:DEAD/DEAH box helicase [Methylocystis sp. SC2]